MRPYLEPTALKGFPSGSASRLRSVIDRIALKEGGIPRSGDQVTIYPYQRNGRQEDMIVDTRPVRRIGKRANQVKFGKQPNGTLFPVAMSPTNKQLFCWEMLLITS